MKLVIPGRAMDAFLRRYGADPDSRCLLSICIWIPGPALRAVPE